jgi:uncharacterized lipoprotein YajG
MQCLHINCGSSRRGFLSGLAALGAGSLLSGCETLDKSYAKTPRIDIPSPHCTAILFSRAEVDES